MRPVPCSLTVASSLLITGSGYIVYWAALDSGNADGSQFNLWDGQNASGQLLIPVSLTDGETTSEYIDDLAIRTNNSVPADAWLPAPVAPTVLANLQSVTVAALSNSTVTIDTKKAPPSGGGFEIRLRDNGFMAGSDSTLVMRSAAQNLTFSRRSFTDRFYIRMYDGATPPNYSEFSAALFFNLPL